MQEYNWNDKIQLTKNWNTYEFRCRGKNHRHKTKINLDLVNKAQNFMDTFGYDKAILSRGYSCSAYNEQIGGSKVSKHVTEGAMDVCFYQKGKIVPAKIVCTKAQDFGFTGIAYIDKNYVHLDLRKKGIYRGDETRGYASNVNNDFYSYFNIKKDNNSIKDLQRVLNITYNTNLDINGILDNKTIQVIKNNPLKRNNRYSNHVKWLQEILTKLNYSLGTSKIDGYFGLNTYIAVQKLQRDNLLKDDGIVGIETTKILLS